MTFGGMLKFGESEGARGVVLTFPLTLHHGASASLAGGGDCCLGMADTGDNIGKDGVPHICEG